MRRRSERFEDLIAWQKARALTQGVYGVTRSGALARDFRLSGQMRQSAVCVMSSLAEGFERGTRPELYRFLSIAKSCCAELRSHLYVALDAGYLPRDGFGELCRQAEEIDRLVGGLRSAVSADGGVTVLE